MPDVFVEKKAKVLIVEHNSTSRSVISDVVKGLGFSNIQSMDTAKAALGFLEVEAVDWVLLPLSAAEQVNALHLLEIFSRNPHLARVRMSLFLDDGEQLCLPQFFELGLLSWHRRQFTKDSLKTDLSRLIERFTTFNGDQTLISADILREQLKETKSFKSILSLFESLHNFYPENKWVHIGLAEAQFLNGRKEAGRIALGQMQLLGLDGWESIAKEHLAEGEQPVPDLGIRTCVIVDSDDAVQKAITTVLNQSSVTNVHCFSEGESAMAWLQSNPPPDMLMQEWRIPKISGPLFLQRVRQAGLHNIPIVIVSSLVNKNDTNLLSEMGVANVITKPVDSKDFLHTCVSTLLQEKVPTLHRTLERKIHGYLLDGNPEEAQKLNFKVQSDPTASQGFKKYIEALIAYYNGRTEMARTLVVEALQHGAEQVKAVNLLGRCLAKLRDFAGASKCFKKAQMLSPKNIERLCELADCQTEMGDLAAAAETIDQAKTLDAKNENVTESESKLALHKGEIAKARELLMQLGSLAGLVSDMNNTAVSHIRCGEFNEGIVLYQRTIDALPENQVEVKLRVQYNFALAYARQEKLPDSLKVLDSMVKDADFPIQAKIFSLRSRLANAIETKTPLKLSAVSNAESTTDEATAKALSTDPAEVEKQEITRATEVLIEAHPGQRCCHLIFHPVEPLDALFVGLRANAPNFKPRAAIERQDGMGLERMMSQ